MGACAHTMPACAAVRSDRTDMRAGIDAVPADSRTTAGDRADMCARAHAMCADMCANAHAQHINAAAYILGAGRSGAYDKAKSKYGNDFHGILRHGASRARR